MIDVITGMIDAITGMTVVMTATVNTVAMTERMIELLEDGSGECGFKELMVLIARSWQRL